jgi:aminoglycoside phosphotransferase (APT) family kinase protein
VAGTSSGATGVELHKAELTARARAGLRSAGHADTIIRIDPLPGGLSSLTYVAQLAAPGTSSTARALGHVVLKVAPAGLAPVRNRDVLRQARVLRVLHDAPGVRVPEVVFEDPGDPPDVPPLFGMTYVDGVADEPLDEGSELPGPVADARSRAAARMLGALHGVDPHAVGLEGEAAIGLDQEVARWIAMFETVDDDLRHGAQACGERLLASIPAPTAPAICHGDFRLGNLLCSEGDVRAIIDWEIWSLGDRRADLAWFLHNSDANKPSAVRADPGLPPPAALLEEYEAVAAAVGDMQWFLALVRFKQAAAMAMIVKHGRRGSPADPKKMKLAEYIDPLLNAVSGSLPGE